MKFAIITHTTHKIVEKELFAYEPYIREMNLWMKYVSEAKVVSPISDLALIPIESNYTKEKINHIVIPGIHFIGLKNKIISTFKLPIILIKIFRIMLWADHVHIRCPGNIGLLGCIVQVFFPFKKKTVKYAGNWDPKSKQPLSYRFQKWIISNRFLTRNCKVLVYGVWKNQSKNIFPFFTASYKEKEIKKLSTKNLSSKINFIYVGAFTEEKQPMLSVKTTEILANNGFNVLLNMYGNGVEFEKVKEYVSEKKLTNIVFLHGNQPKEIVKEAFQRSHFLVFISKSEGWPKVVAEAMFWSCLPIASKVSCVPSMLNEGNRGALVNPNVDEIVRVIRKYLANEKLYLQQIEAAKKWSQNFTLDKFEKEISKILTN